MQIQKRSSWNQADCLDDLRAEVIRVTGAGPVDIAKLERIKPRTLVTFVMVTIAMLTLVPQLVGIGALWGELGNANWWWAAVALALSAATYVGAAVALGGSVPERLPLVWSVGVQVATTFANVVVPGGLVALPVRFLQKRGIDVPRAVAAVSIYLIAGAIVHVGFIGLFVALAGTSGLEAFTLPSLGTSVLVLVGVAAVAALGFAVPRSRALINARVLPGLERAMSGIGQVARIPRKMAALFGGSGLITMGNILALVVCVAAFGSGPALTSVALVYLLGSAVGAAVPTAGGLGAVEAALIAGLTSAGMDASTALAAVILFRLTTFWIPTLVGWIMFLTLQRSTDL